MGTILWSVLGSVLGSVIGLIMRSVIRSVSTDYHSQHIKSLKEQAVTRLLLWCWMSRIWVCKMPRLIYKSNAEMNRWNLTPIESITFWRMIVTWTDLVTDPHHNHRWWIHLGLSVLFGQPNGLLWAVGSLVEDFHLLQDRWLPTLTLNVVYRSKESRVLKRFYHIMALPKQTLPTHASIQQMKIQQKIYITPTP